MNRYYRSLEARQALRTRIARQRRRLDRQIDGITDGVLLIGSWGRFVQRHPGRCLFGAAGIGVLIGHLFSNRLDISAIERQLLRCCKFEALAKLWRNLMGIFQSDSKTASPEPSEEQRDG